MSEFRCLHGTVYILQNSKAKRVKVGMTTNNVTERLRDVNDMWLGRKVTCQICGGRLVNTGGYVPQHVLSGVRCPGGNALPFEKDLSLAETHIENLKGSLVGLSGSEKGSVTRMIKTLEKRIGLYQDYNRQFGTWRFSVSFYTENVEQVESLSHKYLEKRLDKLAPFGEVFCCSVSKATEAVESALNQLGLLQSVKKETNL